MSRVWVSCHLRPSVSKQRFDLKSSAVDDLFVRAVVVTPPREQPDTTENGEPGRASDPHDVSPVRACLARILEGSDLPALSRQVIDAIAALDNDASSLQRLANVVLREYSLTASVMRTANSAHYRRIGRPVQSATHAMMLLGAGTVRSLATSLLLFENMQRRSAGLRELMLLSLLSANHAREVAIRLGAADPGEAHLCGMFRNLGEVLVACHLPDEYAQIHARQQVHGDSPSRACYRVLGFQYEELGEETCRQWGMPEAVAQGIRASATSATTQVASITAFSHDLTNALYRRESAGPDAQAGVDAVLARYASRIRLSRDQLREVVEMALTETRELFITARVSIDALRLRELRDAAHDALGVAATRSADWAVVEDHSTDSSALIALRGRLSRDVSNVIDPACGTDVSSIMLLALEAMLRGGPFDRAVVAMLNGERTRLSARAGLGVNVEALMAKFDFPMTARGGPIAAALQHPEPTYLPVDRAMNLVELRWTLGSGIAQFGVVPIVVSNTVIGCFYVDRLVTDPLPDSETLAYLHTVVQQVVEAIDVRRGASASLDADARSALVLRVLRGEELATVARTANVTAAQLESWRVAFLAGAVERVGEQ